LSALYVAMAALSILYGVTTEVVSQLPDDAVESTTLLLFLISVSLVPSFLIKNPHFDLGLAKHGPGTMACGIAAVAGIVGFICLLPPFIASLSIDAYASKNLGETAVAQGGTPFVTVGSFVSAFSCIFGLLLFSDTKWQLGWIVRVGLLIGFLNYGVVMECNKSRDFVVYYIFYFLLYFWLFRHKWRWTMKAFYYVCVVCVVGGGAALFTVKTVQRFGHSDAWSAPVLDGTAGYLGQQVSTFIEVAEEPDIVEGHAQMDFPVYFYVLNGEWVDVSQLLAQRTKAIESGFSTYVGSLFLAIGRRWAVAAVLLSAVSAFAFFSRPTQRSPGTYVVGIMLYYQILFQGVFYWMQGGRFGNGFIIVMLLLGITLYFKWGCRPAVSRLLKNSPGEGTRPT